VGREEITNGEACTQVCNLSACDAAINAFGLLRPPFIAASLTQFNKLNYIYVDTLIK